MAKIENYPTRIFSMFWWQQKRTWVLLGLVLGLVWLSWSVVQVVSISNGQPQTKSQPDLQTEVAKPIPKNYSEIMFVYFRYGNPTKTTVTPKAAVSLRIEGQGLVIDRQWVHDLYYKPDPQNKIPQVPLCSNEYDGFDYPISSSLFINEQELIYGPQSAKVLREPSGEAVSELPPRATGCIRIGLRVSPEAKVGDVTRLIFNPDYQQSSPETSPGLQTIELYIGSENFSCPEGQEFVQGECQPMCANNQFRDQLGLCRNRSNPCQGNLDWFDGRCVPKCGAKEKRLETGECVVVNDSSWINLFGYIWTVPLLLALFLLYGGLVNQ